MAERTYGLSKRFFTSIFKTIFRNFPGIAALNGTSGEKRSSTVEKELGFVYGQSNLDEMYVTTRTK
jgi:hypothetical protein